MAERLRVHREGERRRLLHGLPPAAGEQGQRRVVTQQDRAEAEKRLLQVCGHDVTDHRRAVERERARFTRTSPAADCAPQATTWKGWDTGDLADSTVAYSVSATWASLAREPVASGGVIDRGEQDVYVAVVDAGDGVAQADGCPVGEAGGEAEHPAFPG